MVVGLLMLLFAACAPAPPTPTDEVPWKDATFTDPITTTITFANTGPAIKEFRANVQDYPLDFKAILPDSLAPGDSAELTLDLHRPCYVFYASEFNITLRILLPGLPRSLVHGDSGVVETGPHKLVYDYLDEVILPLNLIGRQPPIGTDLLQLQATYLAKAYAHYDTVAVPENLPKYIQPLLERTFQLAAYREGITSHFYHLFFIGDTIAVPAALSDSLGRLLARAPYYQSPGYNDAFISWAQLLGEPAHDPERSVTTNIMASRARAYRNFPLAERRADAIASHLAYLQSDQQVYLDKEAHMDSLGASLPEAYRLTVAEIEQSATARSASAEGLLNLLDQEWETPAGKRRAIGAASDGELRLLKFWFAGCVPCLTEQPYELTLLAAYPEVELVYVAHSTTPDTWRKYLDRHKPPAQQQYLVSDTKLKTVVAAAGTTGAPTYILVDAAGAPVCQPCPKPSDPLLGQIIDQH